ncbi:MAG: hypothetical protein BZY73_05255 [SAR202 cluster bacterium Casp-Chloro-G3]|nr:MAG: hypothetical protein BZY73_05255 [SAR202 cluster bacterium Casp-Chloro-G3]
MHGKFFTREEIREMAGFTPEDKYKGTGLWPWFRHQADVIEQEPGRKGKAYRIKTEFYDAMLNCLGM